MLDIITPCGMMFQDNTGGALLASESQYFLYCFILLSTWIHVGIGLALGDYSSQTPTLWSCKSRPNCGLWPKWHFIAVTVLGVSDGVGALWGLQIFGAQPALTTKKTPASDNKEDASLWQ